MSSNQEETSAIYKIKMNKNIKTRRLGKEVENKIEMQEW